MIQELNPEQHQLNFFATDRESLLSTTLVSVRNITTEKLIFKYNQ